MKRGIVNSKQEALTICGSRNYLDVPYLLPNVTHYAPRISCLYQHLPRYFGTPFLKMTKRNRKQRTRRYR